MESNNNPTDEGSETGGKVLSSSEELARQIIQRVSGELSSTPYACKSLTLLPSGTTNFVFRGALMDASVIEMPDEADAATSRSRKVETVVIKVIEGYARLNPAIKIDGRRGPFEALMFGILAGFKGPRISDLLIGARAPHLLYMDRVKSTFVIEDFGPDCVDLKDYISKVVTGENQVRRSRKCLQYLGAWLRAFHEWTLQDGQVGLVEAMRGYEESGRFKRDILYGNISTWCDKVLLLDDETRAIFRRVDEMLVQEFEDSKTRHITDEWGPTHGDFWTGNILVPSCDGHWGNHDLSVVDWEFAHLGPRAYDLGQMIGDLVEKCELSRLSKLDPSRLYVSYRVIDGFVEGYGAVPKAMAFRALVHAGVQLVNWYIRGPKEGLGDEEVRRIVQMGRDMIYHGMGKNEQWFRDFELGRILDLAPMRSSHS